MRKADIQPYADMVAISVDPPSESKKVTELIDNGFPLVRDEDLRVIRAFALEHNMGGQLFANMGYAIIGKSGRVVELQVDPSFGQRDGYILEILKKS